eukprot:502148_1
MLTMLTSCSHYLSDAHIALLVVLIFCWAIIYFCCNTVRSLHKHGHGNKSSCCSAFNRSKCCNKITYLFDLLDSCTDAALALFIVLNKSLASNPYLWRIFSAICCAASIIGVLLLIVKDKVLSTFYPYIINNETFIHTQYATNTSMTIQEWNTIKRKLNHISLLLKHQIMFDLFSASVQDSVQSCVIFY